MLTTVAGVPPVLEIVCAEPRNRINAFHLLFGFNFFSLKLASKQFLEAKAMFVVVFSFLFLLEDTLGDTFFS